MARKSSRRGRTNYNTGGRETNVFTKRSLPLSQFNYKKSVPLHEIEDRRRYHPEGKGRPATTFRAIPSRFKVGTVPFPKAKPQTGTPWDVRTQSNESPPWQIAFEEPSRVLVCVRRKIRKEVLHAFGIAGRRGLGRGGVQFNENSKFSCR